MPAWERECGELPSPTFVPVWLQGRTGTFVFHAAAICHRTHSNTGPHPNFDLRLLRFPLQSDSALNPDQRPARDLIEKREQIVGCDVDAPMRRRAAKGRFIRETVDVNITSVCVHVAASVEARFQALQPENAMRDHGRWPSFPRETDHLTSAEHSADRPAGTDLLSDTMQPKWSLVRTFMLADAKARCGNDVAPAAQVFMKSNRPRTRSTRPNKALTAKSEIRNPKSEIGVGRLRSPAPGE